MPHYGLLIGLLILAAVVAAAADEPAAPRRVELRKVGSLPFVEASGLVKSRQFAGVYWTIPDSGNAPHLYAIDERGGLLEKFLVEAPNLDWEALTIDDAGHLFIGDTGNNVPGVPLPWRWIYRIVEPEPRGLTEPPNPDGEDVPAVPPPSDPPEAALRTVKIDRMYSYKFTGRRRDIESMVWHGDRLYLLSKESPEPADAPEAVLFQLDVAAKSRSFQPLVEVCRIADLPLASDAALSADGRRLAVCFADAVRMWTLDADAGFSVLGQREPEIVRFEKHLIEGCCWDGEDLLLASEKRELFRLVSPFGPAGVREAP